MSLLTRKRVILAKIETTYGVDPTPTGSANAILIRNLNVQPLSTELASRDLVRPFLGNFQQLNASSHVELDFEVEAAGAGSAGTVPGYGALLRACGMSETVTAGTKVEYAPISAGFESVTIYFNVDGVLHKVTGSRGSVELSLNAKQIPVFKFKFIGIYNAPSDTALPTVSYSAFQTPLAANSSNTPTFSLYSISPVLEAFSFNLGNQVDFRALIGNSYVQITDRKAAGQVTFEAVAIATKDFFTISQQATLGAVSLVHGTTGGNKVQIDLPSINLQNPTYQDSQGVQMLQSNYNALPSSSGNDEFKITVL
jgi:hypothetical protein